MLSVQRYTLSSIWNDFTSVSFSSVCQVSSLDLDAVSWSQWCSKSLLTLWFMISWISSYLWSYHSSLRMMSYSWFHFLCCCTQTVLLTTVVLSCSDFVDIVS
jgi:hypothetical protein